MRHTDWTSPVMALVLLVAAGCGQTAGPARPLSRDIAAVKHTPLTRSAARPAAVPGEGAQPKVQRAENQSTKAFSPPYPNRLDLFRRPEAAVAGSTTRANQPGASRVVLRGFVDVNGMHALLEIDELVTALKPGEERAGVQVVEIAPPQVILQRGRIRWTERLYALP